MQAPAPLTGRGFLLLAATDFDLPWLRLLYAGTRAEELAAVPWPDVAKQCFLEQQFALQHHHYLTHHADADFLTIKTSEQVPVGRYYLRRGEPEHLLVDISLFSPWRGQGIATTLIRQSQAEAAALGRGMCLHVLETNPQARRLYERLGFVAEASTQSGYCMMRWAPGSA